MATSHTVVYILARSRSISATSTVASAETSRSISATSTVASAETGRSADAQHARELLEAELAAAVEVGLRGATIRRQQFDGAVAREPNAVIVQEPSGVRLYGRQSY